MATAVILKLWLTGLLGLAFAAERRLPHVYVVDGVITMIAMIVAMLLCLC